MLSWIIILGGLATSWYFTDLDSESSFANAACPLLVAVFLIATFMKVAATFGGGKGPGSGDGSGPGGFGGFDGGGGGCGGDSGGGC